VYDLKADALEACGSFQTNGRVSGLEFSPDSKYIGVCTAKKQVKVIETSDFKVRALSLGFIVLLYVGNNFNEWVSIFTNEPL